MDILLIGGLWLEASAWTEVAARLAADGHRAVPITLPGQGDGNTSATLADQLAAVVTAIDATDGKAFVAGHSASSTLVWLAADARPDKVGKVAFIGGFPSGDGSAYFSFLPTEGDALPFPGWDKFEEADYKDLDEDARRALAASAIPVPAGVTSAVISLTDARRYDIAVVAVCPEYTAAQAREWIDGGEVPELAKCKNITYVDIDSGHWPMITAPAELAGLLGRLARES